MAQLSEYKITMVTLAAAPPVGTTASTGYEPWYKVNSFTLSSATVSSFTVLDDDPLLDIPRYKAENEQLLTNNTTFGSQTVLAGTRLSQFRGSIIEDSTGNRFFASFPMIGGTSTSSGNIAGAKLAVMIMPLPVTDQKTGAQIFPVFDASRTFKYISELNFSTSSPSVSYAPASVVCFASGTMIETMFGPRAIESLSAGDMIKTRDRGFQPLRWIGETRLDAERLDLQPNLRPILIRAHALAPGVPARDLRVSPQHRVLVRSVIARRMFDEDEILVAAKHLAGLPGIEVLNPQLGVTYHHMLFDTHEVVLSDGAWSESLFTGPEALKSVGEAARREILTLFPQLADPDFQPKRARRLLSGREGRKLAERHGRNGKQLVAER